MKAKQCLMIVLPEGMENMPVQVVRGTGYKNLIASIEQVKDSSHSTEREEKYAFVWQQNDYLNVPWIEIMWIEAAGSYSILHLTSGKTMTLSFHLAVIEKQLPETDFIRIHRSYLVNLKHVTALVGNSLKIGEQFLVIGREYREQLFDRFVFLGVRRSKKR